MIFSQTWQFDDSPTRQNLARLDMLNDSLGWAVSYDGLLLKYSSNKWEIVDTLNNISKFNFASRDSSLAQSNIGDIYSIRVPDTGKGWITANNVYEKFYVIAQFDQKTLEFNAETLPIKIRAQDFYNSKFGIAVGDGGGYFYKDGKWISIKFPLSVDFKDVKIVNREKIFICGEKGTLLVGNENGWTHIKTDLKVQLRDMDFISENEGWIVGYNGTVLHYKDGIVNQEIAESFKNLWAVDMITPKLGYAVGKNGVILNYNGEYWDISEQDFEMDLHDIESINANTIFMVGAGGTILHLSDEEPI